MMLGSKAPGFVIKVLRKWRFARKGFDLYIIEYAETPIVHCCYGER